MKLFSIFFFSFAMASYVHAAPIVVTAPVDHLFVPKGFDNNDNVEVVVSGTFPNTCYSRNKVDLQIKGEQISVKVTALNNNESPDRCEDFEIPFLENVTIGNLQAGKYNILVNGVLSETLNIDVSPSHSVDDHLYAMISYVELGFTRGLGGNAILVGKNMNDCLKLDKIEYISNGKDTLSILPIMKKVATSCSGRREYLEIPIKFRPSDFDSDVILLFVRTMDGKSVSGLVDKNGY